MADIAERVSGRSVSAEKFARAALCRVACEDGRLRAFREVWPEHAVRVAREVDAAVARGATFPLAGVPIAVKAWGGATSAIAGRLIAAGCVPIGAASVPGPGTDHQTWGGTARGPTRNPWRPDRVPGGSSAGSAAAVAAGIVPLATGGDSAGSIRIPAAWCGVLGMKPTNAWLPTRCGDGLGALGPLTADTGDLATVLDVLFSQREGRFTRALATEGQRSAVWSPTLGFAATDAEIAGIAYGAARRLAAAGRVALRRTPEVELVDPARAWMALRRRRADPAAGAERAEIERRLRKVFEQVELILTPTTPCGPHGHNGPGDRVSTELTWTFNLTGNPALSVPAGFTASGLPVGLQIVAKRHHDHLLPAAAGGGKRG